MTGAKCTSSTSRSAAWLAAKTKNAQKKQRIVLEKELRKTKMCKYFAQGKPCYAGDNCDFAHSEEEITARPVLSKTQLCINYAEGRCTDKNCNFAHGEDELRAMQWRYHGTDLEQSEVQGVACRVPLKEAVSRLPNNWTTKQKLTAAIAKHADNPGEASANLSGESTQSGESIETSSDGASDLLELARASHSGLKEPEEILDPCDTQEKVPQQSRLCKYYVQGYCHFGSRCHYAHSVKEMSMMPESAYVTQLCALSDEAKYEEAMRSWVQSEQELADTRSAMPRGQENANLKKKKKKVAGRKQPAPEASPRDKEVLDAAAPSALVPGPIKLEQYQAEQIAPGLLAPFDMMRLVEPMKVQQTEQAPLCQDLGNMMRQMAQLSSILDISSSDGSLKAEIAGLRNSVSALTEQVTMLGQRVPAAHAPAKVPPFKMAHRQTGYEHSLGLSSRSASYMGQPSMMVPPPPGLS